MKYKFGLLERKRKVMTTAVAVTGIAFAIFTYDTVVQSEAFDNIFDVAGIVLVVSGILGRLWSTSYIGGLKNKSLVTTGPYSMCRNPLYFFSFIAGLGVCLEFENLILLVFYFGAFVLYYPGVIRSEGERLEQLFGDEYRSYKKSTPAFFPRRLSGSLAAEMPQVSGAILWKSMRDNSVFLLLLVVAVVMEMLNEAGIVTPWHIL